MGISTFDEATRPGGTGYVDPLPRCLHGNCLVDGAGERLEPPCGCRVSESRVVTFYKLDCPKCGTVTVGEAVIGDPNWNLNGSVACGKSEGDYCDYIGVPETRKVDLAR